MSDSRLEAVRLSIDFVSNRNTQYFAILTVISLQSCDKGVHVDCEKQCELYQTGFKCDEINKNWVKYNRIFCFFNFSFFHLFVSRIKIERDRFIFHRKQGRNKAERTGTIISIKSAAIFKATSDGITSGRFIISIVSI